MAFAEAKEQFGKMLRWTQQPKNADQESKTIFIGEQIQGFFIGKKDNVGKNESSVYEIQLPSGEIVAFWGSDLLDGKFKDIPVNCEVRVKYLGISQPKSAAGRAYANFFVEFDASSKKPMTVAGVGVAPVAEVATVAAPQATPVQAQPVAAAAQAVAPATNGDGF